MTWIAVTGVLLIILLANQLTRVLSQAAANDFPREVVWALIGLTTAGNLSIIVPIGFFLAIMLALGRLYHESEMAAIQSCGVGPVGLFRPITVLGVVIVGLLTWLSFSAIPAASARAQEIRAAALRDAQFGLLEPGRFRTFSGGRIVFYAERVDGNGVLHNVNVFVERPAAEPGQDKAGVFGVPGRKSAAASEPNAAQPRSTETDAGSGAQSDNQPDSQPGTRPDANPPDAQSHDQGVAASAGSALAANSEGSIEGKYEIWVATRAEQRGAGQAEQLFVLYDGVRYEGIPGSGEFRVITFSEGGIPIRLGEPGGRAPGVDMKPTAELLKSDSVRDLAELHWRIATPISALVLMLIAVPLSRLRPRQGRFGKIGIAILSYFLYQQTLVAARTWIENGTLPEFLGLWWVHGLALCVALWLLIRQNPLGRATPVPAGA